MQAITEAENVTVTPEEPENKKPVIRVSPLPKMESIKENTILITLSFEIGGSAVWALHLEDINGIDEETLSLLEVSVLLTDLSVLPEGSMVASIFKVIEIVEDSPFPYRNEEVYVQPYFDENGVMTYYEVMAKNNEDFFVYWNIEDGFEVKSKKTNESLLVLQEVNIENPHFIGKDALMLIEIESNARLLFSVYDKPGWSRENWNYLLGSMLGMCFGTLNGYEFVTGKTDIEEIAYSNRIMQDINAVDSYKLSIFDAESDSYAAINLDTDCVVLHCH